MGYGDDLLVTAFAAKIKKKFPERQIVIGNSKAGTAFYSRVWDHNPNIADCRNLSKDKVKDVMSSCPWISEVRGLGAMQGIVITDEHNEPDKKHTSRIYQNAMKNGLMMITAGTDGNVIRTLMPLTIKNGDLDQSLEILSNALKVP